MRTPVGRLIGQMIPGQTPQGAPVTISVRPETLSLGPTIPAGWNRFPATIERITFRGELRHIQRADRAIGRSPSRRSRASRRA